MPSPRFDRHFNTCELVAPELLELISIYKRLRAFDSRIGGEPEIFAAAFCRHSSATSS
jgi:hypothetical protein